MKKIPHIFLKLQFVEVFLTGKIGIKWCPWSRHQVPSQQNQRILCGRTFKEYKHSIIWDELPRHGAVVVRFSVHPSHGSWALAVYSEYAEYSDEVNLGRSHYTWLIFLFRSILRNYQLLSIKWINYQLRCGCCKMSGNPSTHKKEEAEVLLYKFPQSCWGQLLVV